MRRLAPNPDFNEIAKRGTEDVAGGRETLIKSSRLTGTLPGLAEPVGGGTEILYALKVMEVPEVAEMAWEKPEIQALEEPLLAPSAQQGPATCAVDYAIGTMWLACGLGTLTPR